MGTRKFTSFLLFKSLPLSTILLCLLLELSDLTDNTTTTTLAEPSFAPGPYPHIGALLYLYHTYTPKQHPRLFGLLGIDFSEKAFTYGFALQSCLSNGWSSTLPVAVGYVAGWIASSPLLHEMLGEKWDVVPLPRFLLRSAEGVARATGLDVLCYAPTTGVVGLAGPSGRRGGGGGGQVLLPRRPGGPNGGGVAPPVMGGGVPVVPPPVRFEAPPPPPPPSEEAVGQLTAMGFDREAVVRALQATDNNVGAAANRLLSGS